MQNTGKPNGEDRQSDLRKEIDDADATGLVAGEELITQAETLLPIQKLQQVRDVLPQGHAAHATIDQLQNEMQRPNPDPSSIEKHVGILRSLPELEATIANWWDDPQTQRYVWSLSQGGL
jgi:hypothetical protein